MSRGRGVRSRVHLLAPGVERGVFVVESHTHLEEKDYAGPDSDRIKVLVDRDGDGRADRVTVTVAPRVARGSFPG